MVALAAGVVACVVTAGAAAPAVAGVASGVVTTAATSAAATAATVAGSAGAGMVTGAVAGAVASGTITAGATGAVVGAGAAAAASSSSAGAAALTAGIAAGPIGWLILGAGTEELPENCTFDSWKPVLRDESTEPSKGRLLMDVVADRRLKNVIILEKQESVHDFPEIVLENVWGEKFRLEYVTLPLGTIALHAIRLDV